MQTAETALEFARWAHRNQRGHDGRPYIEHVERVVAEVRSLLGGLPEGLLPDGESDAILQAAALHDCAEDHAETGVTHEALADHGFAPAVLAMVHRLDKAFKVGSYQVNIEAMAAEGVIGVVVVKLGDNRDNRRPERIASLPPEMRSILRRYERAGAVLQGAYDAFATPAPSPR